MQKTGIIIAGPTAVGKTALAIEVAKRYHTEIISADSRQCYHELEIGVARPGREELSQVAHHFIDCISIQEAFTAADYEKFALNKVQEIFQRKDIVVICGGTGLYLRAFTQGLDDIPAIPAFVRREIESNYAQKGLKWLQEILQEEDPVFAKQGEMQNPHRMMRALEVMRGTKQSIIEFQTGQKKQRDFRIIQVCLELPREQLYARINQRVDTMIQMGLEAEARGLFSFRDLPALQTVGYREMFRYFLGEIGLPEAIEEVKQNTRRYAKRQETWFKKVPGMLFCPADEEALLTLIETTLSA